MMTEQKPEHFCCKEMRYHITNGKVGLIYVDKYREYGLEYRDGGTSYQIICFCPWCGSKLPLSLRDEWFDCLNKLGIDDPFISEIPKQYETSDWWKSRMAKKEQTSITDDGDYEEE